MYSPAARPLAHRQTPLPTPPLTRHPPPVTRHASLVTTQIQDVQHQRYEYFQRQRDLRQLLHVAIVGDEALFESQMAQMNEWHLPGHMRYGACMYATAKALDKITAVARCALEAEQRGARGGK